MCPSNDDILCIVQNVLSTMANTDVETCPITEVDRNSLKLAGCVQISGEWQGAIVLRTSERFVRNAAAQMLQTQADELIESDLQDVLAEITNMIGGNIKSQMPGPSFLSIPSVTSGQSFEFQLNGARVLSQTHVCCGDEQLNVLIWESSKCLP